MKESRRHKEEKEPISRAPPQVVACDDEAQMLYSPNVDSSRASETGRADCGLFSRLRRAAGVGGGEGGAAGPAVARCCALSMLLTVGVS